LEKDPVGRLGTKGDLEEVMSHPFMRNLGIDDLLTKKIEAPFKPKLSADLLDVSCFDKQFTSEEVENSMIPQQKLDVIKRHKD
jgi:hypothetical protein